MKKLFLVIFLIAGVSSTAFEICEPDLCGSSGAGSACILAPGESANEDCCKDFCRCICCINLPVQAENDFSCILPYIEIPIQNHHQNFIFSFSKKHWQPPKV